MSCRGRMRQLRNGKRCTRLTDQNLGEAVGQDWVKQYFPAKSLKAESGTTRRRAQEVARRGHSNSTLDDRSDYSRPRPSLRSSVRKSAIPTSGRTTGGIEDRSHRPDWQPRPCRDLRFRLRHEQDRQAGRDEKEWGMTPPTVNAYYDSFHERHQLPSRYSAATLLRSEQGPRRSTLALSAW